MVGMTEEWIRAPIKCFDFTYYLTCFFEVCLKLDMIDVIGKYVKELTATSLLAISQLFYRNSFNEEQRKSFLPELVDDESRFASITSVGFASKSLTLDIIMPNYAEQFMWK